MMYCFLLSLVKIGIIYFRIYKFNYEYRQNKDNYSYNGIDFKVDFFYYSFRILSKF